MCLHCLTYAPTKNNRIGTKQPWITSHVKRLSRRIQRLYNLARHTNSSHTIPNWDTYQHLKKEVQHKCCKVYNEYKGSLVDENGAITKKL